jgi:hypothetical protein
MESDKNIHSTENPSKNPSEQSADDPPKNLSPKQDICSDKSLFDGISLIKSTLILNSLVYFFVGIQHIFIPLLAGLPFYNFSFITYILFLLGISSLFGAKYYKTMPMAVINSLLLLIGIAAFGFLSIFFNGIFNQPMFVVDISLLILNGIAFGVNMRAHFMKNLGNAIIIILLAIMVLVFIAVTYTTYIDKIALVLLALIVAIAFEPFVRKMKAIPKNQRYNLKFLIGKIFQSHHFNAADFTTNRKKKLMGIGLFCGLSLLFGIGSFTSFGSTITVKAPDNFKTLSSYWGPPSLSLKSHTSKITVVDPSTLQISNDTLSTDPSGYIVGSLAYLYNLSVPGNSVNYINYSAGTESYPNGTIFLHTPLPTTINVSVSFYYVSNHQVLQDLKTGNSTLVMNFHGNFIYEDNIFKSIKSVYLLQLLDHWHVKFYLDIYNGIEFPHVFNYKDSIPIGNTTLNWAHGKWSMFQGISYDFEPGGNAVPKGNPGGENMSVGESIGSASPWDRFQKDWYKRNEQNRTLFKESTAEYEKLYAYASKLGYKTYITLGMGEVYDNMDGDIDFTRCPVDPISPNPDVLYGHMNYQDNNFVEGRYRVYSGCKNQITLLGNQGKTILLGWLAKGTRYYTDDEIGLQRYIDDCKIAQAAGMEEIFHAPIYRMQGKWGDDAILKLHNALNNDTKKEFTISIPTGILDDGILYDMIENLNYLWIAGILYGIIIARLLVFGPLQLKNKILKKTKKN